MAVHDYIIDNSTGANVRADINNALAAIVSNNSSSSQPATRYAYMWWADTTTGILKIRNSANDGWVELLQLDGTLTMEDGSAANPAIAFRNDLDCGIFRPEANALGIATAGAARLVFNTNETNFNDGGTDLNFRVESNNNANQFFVDAGEDRVGIGTGTPSNFLHCVTSDTTVLLLESTASGGTGVELLLHHNSASPADNDNIGAIYFQADHDGGSKHTFAYILTQATDVSDGSEDANLIFATSGGGTAATRLTIDNLGNVGIGITPDTQGSTVKSLQIGSATNLFNETSDDYTVLANNAYYDGSTNKRIKAQEVSRILMNAGNFTFERAGADSADSNITFQKILETNENGTVFLKGEATSDNNRLQIRVDDTLATFMSSCNSATERNIAFHTRNTSGSLAATITANGIAMPSGKGIDFAADGSASGMSSELFNDYEEGTFSPNNTIGMPLANEHPAQYVKIGNMCYINMDITFNSSPADSSQCGLIQNLPFTSINLTISSISNNTNGEQQLPIPFVSESSSSNLDHDLANTVFFIGKNESRIDIFNFGLGAIQQRAFLAGRRMRFNFCYRTE